MIVNDATEWYEAFVELGKAGKYHRIPTSAGMTSVRDVDVYTYDKNGHSVFREDIRTWLNSLEGQVFVIHHTIKFQFEEDAVMFKLIFGGED